MTNENYLNATSTTTSTIGGTTYITSLTFEMEPSSSTVIRFYKTDVSQNYTYSSSTGGSTPIITLTNNALIGA